MEETRLHLIFLISAYAYAFFWLATFHFHPSATSWPNSLLEYLSSSSSSRFMEPVDKRRPVSLSRLYPMIVDKDVAVLTETNFTQFLKDNRYVAVNFYAPWCHWCRRLAPEYAAAATAMKGLAVMTKVDATLEPDLAKKYGVQNYPTIYFFIDGVKKRYDYSLERSREAIVSWLKHQMNGGLQSRTDKKNETKQSPPILLDNIRRVGFGGSAKHHTI